MILYIRALIIPVPNVQKQYVYVTGHQCTEIHAQLVFDKSSEKLNGTKIALHVWC